MGPQVLVLSTDPLGPVMPGPAVRAWELAAALGRHLDVVLGSTVAVEGEHPSAELRLAHGPALREMVEAADVCFVPSALAYMADELRDGDKVMAVDIYDPYHLENLEMGGGTLAEQDFSVARQAGVLNCALRRGDFFTCASERQRDFWLGSLAALGRVNPYNRQLGPLVHGLLAVVPYGLPSRPPARHGPALRGVVPGIGDGDEIVLWGGGIYNWLDPLSVLKAIDRLRQRRPQVRLVFLGAQHPNPAVPAMRVASELQELSDRLGLTGKHVYFNRGWVPYERRADFLLEADVGVSAHLDHLETRYSFRSRVLDYLWARLPMVLTAGDVLAEEVARAGLGVAVPPGDDQALEEALERVLTQPPPKERFDPVARAHTWERAAEPLLQFCRQPRRAPDQLVTRASPDEAARR